MPRRKIEGNVHDVAPKFTISLTVFVSFLVTVFQDMAEKDERSCKRAKLSCTIENVRVCWQYEAEDGWTSYIPAHQEALCKAFSQKKKEVSVLRYVTELRVLVLIYYCRFCWI